MANYNENENNNNNAQHKAKIPDVLAYNNCGVPLYAGIFTMTREEVENQIRTIVLSFLNIKLDDKSVQVVITAFKNDRTKYDEETKSNVADFSTEFQVRFPEKHSAIAVTDKAANNNVFLSGRTEYTDSFKNFVNTYGIQSDKGNAIDAVNKHKKQVIVLLNPERLFSTFFDTKNKRYNEENQQKCTRQMKVRIKNLYDHEDPLATISGAPRRIRSNSSGDANLTGFVIIKTYADLGSDTPYKYRAAYSARRKHYEE